MGVSVARWGRAEDWSGVEPRHLCDGAMGECVGVECHSTLGERMSSAASE